jgi:hypothetical protein
MEPLSPPIVKIGALFFGFFLTKSADGIGKSCRLFYLKFDKTTKSVRLMKVPCKDWKTDEKNKVRRYLSCPALAFKKI